jgi:tripartite ATP-independent transporter DctP family solute receptor
MFYRILAAILVWLVCLSVNAQQKEQRIALVVGNSSYKSSPLKNPVNDARDMANSLRGYGFTVIERTNLTTRQVGQTLREFRSKLTPGSVAVVFYAGHGLQIKGENYLPTVDAEINGEEDVPMQSLSTRQVMDILGEAKTRMNLVFLDACRDNPYARSFRSGSRGIAKENAPSGTLISFATRPGSVAADGDGRNGLYTSVLLEQIKQSDQPIEQVLKRVVSGVKVASRGQQEPWMEGSIEGDFCFSQCSFYSVTSKPDPDEQAWIVAQGINSIAGYQAYLDSFPNGKFISAARIATEHPNLNSEIKPNQSLASIQAVTTAVGSQIFTTELHQVKTLKFTNQNAAGHPIALGMEKFKDIVEKNSGGKLKVNLILGGALGSDRANISAIQGGSLEMASMNSGIFASQVKDFGVFDFPFLFASTKEADAVVDGPFGKKMHAKLEEKGLIGLAYYELAFRHITNGKRAINKVSDIEGLKLRVIPNPINVDWAKALGANPTPLPFPELYAALEQGAVDGQENPIPTINGAKLYEVQKHMVLTSHQYNPQSVVISKKFWDTLSAGEKKVVANAAAESAKFQRETSRNLEASLLANLKKNGMQVTQLTESEMAILRDKMKPVIVKHGEPIAATVAELQGELAKLRK